MFNSGSIIRLKDDVPYVSLLKNPNIIHPYQSMTIITQTISWDLSHFRLIADL